MLVKEATGHQKQVIKGKDKQFHPTNTVEKVITHQLIDIRKIR